VYLPSQLERTPQLPYVMVAIVKGVGVHFLPHKVGLIFPL
jgi:hypothetical protein